MKTRTLENIKLEQIRLTENPVNPEAKITGIK